MPVPVPNSSARPSTASSARKSTVGARITGSNLSAAFSSTWPRRARRGSHRHVPRNGTSRGEATSSGTQRSARGRQRLQQSRDRHSRGSTDNPALGKRMYDVVTDWPRIRPAAYRTTTQEDELR
jgi:hypothetical protein